MLGSSRLIEDIEKLADRLGAFQDRHPADLEDANEELRVSLEELRVAHEELSQQNRELEESRIRAEIQERRYRELFDSAPEGYIVTSPKGSILEANRQAARLIGVQPQRLSRKPITSYIPRPELPDFRARLNRIPFQI